MLRGAGELAFRLFLADAVGHDARRFLEDLAAVLALLGEDLVDASLTDQGVALAPDARVPEQLLDIPEPAGHMVQLVFAVPVAVDAAGHADLGEGAFQLPVLVVEQQGDLAERGAPALLRAAEYDVLHARAAQGLGALLAEHPAHGVADIALAGAVGAHDARDALAEDDLCPVGEGFEAVEFKLFQFHWTGFPSNEASIAAAAACSARFLLWPWASAELPSSRQTRTVNTRAWSGPSSRTSS